LVIEIYRLLVAVLIAQGRLDDARDISVLAFRSVPEEDAWARAAALLIEASVRTADKDELAVEKFAQALELIEQQGLPLDLAEARLAYGQALRHLGKTAAARAELAHAREDVERLGARTLVIQIDRELGVPDAEGAGVAGPFAGSS